MKNNFQHTSTKAVCCSKQVIVRVGCEGGALTMFGVQSPDGWKFRVETNEMELLENGDRFDIPKRPWVATWRSALKQLDTYSWTQLFPLEVHLEFQDRVLRALQFRNKKGCEIDWVQWGDVLNVLIAQ